MSGGWRAEWDLEEQGREAFGLLGGVKFPGEMRG